LIAVSRDFDLFETFRHIWTLLVAGR